MGIAGPARLALAALLLGAMPSAHAALARPGIAPAAMGEPQLRPGQFAWYTDPAALPAGRIGIVISLAAQRAYVYRNGALIGVSSVSTGRPGKDTPTGSFTILEKQLFHRSNIYSDAPMPFMLRLTWSGIAIHAGSLPGYPASHGCIRLPAGFARTLFDLAALGGDVAVIAGTPGARAAAPVAMADAVPTAPASEPGPPAPQLDADPRGLGGDAFDIVTARAEATSTPPRATRR